MSTRGIDALAASPGHPAMGDGPGSSGGRRDLPSEDQRYKEDGGGDDATAAASLAQKAREWEAGQLAAEAQRCSAAVAAARSGDGDRVPMPGFEARAKEIKEALEAGDVDIRKGLGQRFSAYLKSDAAADEEYRNMKAPGQTMALKRQFRLRWAEMELQKVTEVKKTKLESWQTVDEEVGTYQPLEMIAKMEGGTDSTTAWQAALNYAERAMSLGGMWLSWNAFTRRTEILYIKKSRRQVMTTMWSLYQEQSSRSTNEEVREGETTPLKVSAATAKAAAKALPAKRPELPNLPEGEKKKPRGPSKADKDRPSAKKVG